MYSLLLLPIQIDMKMELQYSGQVCYGCCSDWYVYLKKAQTFK